MAHSRPPSSPPPPRRSRQSSLGPRSHPAVVAVVFLSALLALLAPTTPGVHASVTAANDPESPVEFSVDDGEPFPDDLVPQDRSDASSSLDNRIELGGVYHDTPKRYVYKSARFSSMDNRVFDFESGLVVMASHHWGKNPYESLDPLDLLDISDYMGGEWKSVAGVASYGDDGFPALKIRPKKFSRHGTQYVRLLDGNGDDDGDDDDGVVMTVGKVSRLKSASFSPNFFVYQKKGESKKTVYTVSGDILGRTLSITNHEGQLIARMTKTKTAMLEEATLGTGTESTIDIAPGVDCSTILAIVFATGQVGRHYLKDVFSNFVAEPLQDNAVDSAIDAAAAAVGGADLGGVAAEFADDVTFGIEAADMFVDAAGGLGDVADVAVDGFADAAEGVVDLLLALFG